MTEAHLVCLALAAVVLIAPSIPFVRRLLAAPLVVSADDPAGDAAYLLAGGDASRERLSAAAALFHAGKVPLLLLYPDPRPASYNPLAGRRWTATEWAVGYLEWRGVPREAIRVLEPGASSRLGTLSEALGLARQLPAGVQRLVLVTSAMHTRRALLAFRRRLPAEVSVLPCAATPFLGSLERYRPLWIEYVKLLVYAVVLTAPRLGPRAPD